MRTTGMIWTVTTGTDARLVRTIEDRMVLADAEPPTVSGPWAVLV